MNLVLWKFLLTGIGDAGICTDINLSPFVTHEMLTFLVSSTGYFFGFFVFWLTGQVTCFFIEFPALFYFLLSAKLFLTCTARAALRFS